MNHFSPSASSALDRALSFAEQLGHTYVGSEHLLLGLIAEKGSAAADFLSRRGVTLSATRGLLIGLAGVGSPTTLSGSDLTPRLRSILEEAAAEARRAGCLLVGTEHLLFSLVSEPQSVGAGLISAQSVSVSSLKTELIAYLHHTPGQPPPSSKGNAKTGGVLEKYGKNLTAVDHRDPIIGREAEILHLIRILSRKTKNNPCLIGEPGVGKTAIVEGLAARIADGTVPDLLRGKQIYSLELSSLVAGAKYRGEFEERMRQVVEEASADSSVILFIDEIHTLMGAGGAEGAVDAANILKPALARGAIRLIGATTLSEYRKIEKDGALERRFQPIMVKEPTPAETLTILQGVRESYEAHHRVVIPDEALEAAVTLSVRYLPDRRLPDKALDLIDEAAACVRVRRSTPPPGLRELERSAASLTDAKENAIRRQDFGEAGKLRDREVAARDAFTSARTRWEKEQSDLRPRIGRAEIAALLTEQTGIPIPSPESGDDLRTLEERLSRRVVGQESAIRVLAAAIRRRSAGLLPGGRPAGSFLFAGPSGVGKTELARAMAEVLFGSPSALIRLDLSEYRAAHSIARLIGAPPGYVGYDEGGLLTEKIRRTPYAVVVFDEIEKAHPDLTALLLQILEEGCLTDSSGRRADFSNAYVLITSNIGATHRAGAAPAGFLSDKSTGTAVSDSLRKTFPPELLSRIDEVIPFRALERSDLVEIARLQIGALADRLCQRIALSWEDTVLEVLADRALRSPEGGARSLRTLIRREIEDPLALRLLSTPAPTALRLKSSAGKILLSDSSFADCEEKNEFFQKSP
ncbi:MAG: ATP-dependent Clp protease ATP-binding subunit [Eubacteriales bacterium]